MNHLRYESRVDVYQFPNVDCSYIQLAQIYMYTVLLLKMELLDGATIYDAAFLYEVGNQCKMEKTTRSGVYKTRMGKGKIRSVHPSKRSVK